MPPKKKKGNKSSSSNQEDGDAVENFVSNYKKACGLINAETNSYIIKSISGDLEDNNEDGDDAIDPTLHLLLADLNLRPSGTRAIAWAILGNGADMKGGSYKNFQSLQFVRCDCRDAGAAAFAEVLRIGPTLDVMIKTLSFVHCNVFSLGCHMLGNALASGMNTSLTTLTLDYNKFGNEGIVKLIHGLRSNCTMETLNLRFCNMEGIDFAASLCDLINNNKSQLSKINVEGNKLGAKGLGVFSRALRKNKTLTTLDISDNAINVDYEPKNFAIFSNGLTSFGEALLINKTLKEINFRSNGIST